MSQIFHHSTNTFARITIYGAVFFLGFAGWVLFELSGSAYVTRQAQAREQPVPFSHAHHVGGIGLDCRYCHSTVETAGFANIPSTKTCMNCTPRSGARVRSNRRASMRRRVDPVDAGPRPARFRLLQSLS
jgi:hypothetical protein